MDYTITKCESDSEIIELKEYYSKISNDEKKDLNFDFNSSIFYKVVKQNLVIGFASVQNDDYNYTDFKRFIATEHRKKSIGENLLDFIVKDATSLKKRRLSGVVREMNENTRFFFERKGFEIIPFGQIEGVNFSTVMLKLKKTINKTWTTNIIDATNEIANSYITGQLILLTESDLKTSLSNKIKEKVSDNITVNTESPWYDTLETNSIYYIDITAFDKEKLKLTYDSTTNRKGYKYDDEAIAIELKYFRHNDDIPKIAGDFQKIRLLIKTPKNDCFIIATARTNELFETAKTFMESQMEIYRTEYNNRVKVYLFSTEKLIEIK